MTTPAPERAPAPPASSQSGRYLFMLLLGVALGVIGIVMVMRAFESRKTWQDRYPTAVMQLMSAHSAQLRQKKDANRCSPDDVLPHLHALRMLGNDLEPAFAELADDRRFGAHASEFRGRLDTWLAAAPDTCAVLEQARSEIGAACKACHQDFR